jgi:hypothetical protein
MKKTLIAMAAAATLATSGAAFAQVTITGYVSGGYMVSTTGGAASATTSGIGGDTTSVDFTALEDIGGGLKAGAAMNMGGLQRGAASVTGGNFAMFVQNEMGKFTIASAKSGDYVSSGLASSGVNYYDYGDVGNFGAKSSRDSITLEVPVGPVSLALAHQEAANVVGGAAGGEGAGSGQRLNVISVTYAGGPIKLNTQYINADNQAPNSATSSANIFRLSGNYNLGVATVGAGMALSTTTSNSTARNMGASVSVPLGSLTLGAMIGSRTTENYTTTALNGTLASYSVSANYALSKRTGIVAQYSNFDKELTSAVKGSMGLLFLTHSF